MPEVVIEETVYEEEKTFSQEVLTILLLAVVLLFGSYYMFTTIRESSIISGCHENAYLAAQEGADYESTYLVCIRARGVE